MRIFLKSRRFALYLIIILLLLVIILVVKIYYKQKLYFSDSYILGTTSIPEYINDGPAVLNPYLGFVDKYPDNPYTNKFGFHGAEPIFKKNNNDFIVGIFGGSFASLYYLYQKDALVKELSLLPLLKNKQIKIVPIALGGFKQPQQLMALNYFLVLGAKFDVVINIDGFNEVALPYTENIPNNISSFFPRQWNLYSRGIFDLKSVTLMNSIKSDKKYLIVLNNIFTNEILKHLSFIYKYLYIKQQTKINNKESELNDYLESLPTDYQTTGPEKLSFTKNEIQNNIITVWERSSIQMANLSDKNGILYLHFLQPNQYLKGSKVLSGNEKEVAYSVDQKYKKPVEIFYPLLIKKSQELKNNGVNFEDLTYLFKDITDTIYIDNCCHINALGNTLITKQIVVGIAKNQ